MTMEAMVEAFKKKGFDVEKVYNKDGGYYRFIIEKYSVEVAGNFKYPAGQDFKLRDLLQREFIEKLIDKWNAEYKNKQGESNMTRQYYVQYAEKLDEIKKGESNMKDNDNLMYALAQTTAGHLHIMGKPYPVMVKDVTVDGRCAGEAATLLTVEVVGRYGDPNDKLYPKYPNNSDGTIRAVFNSLDLNQKRAVYEIIGRAINDEPPYSYGRDLPKIKDVIFNPPATIVFWADNTKTVVKCQEGDDFDPEKGLTMAITKKIFGNKGNYCEEIKKWVKKYKPEPVELNIFELMSSVDFKEALADRLEKVFGVRPEVEVKKSEPIVAETPETADPEGGCPFCKVEGNEKLVDFLNREREKKEDPEKRWKIWWKRYNVHGKHIGSGVHHTDYACRSSATRAAHRMFDAQADIEWTVSQDNPWEEIK